MLLILELVTVCMVLMMPTLMSESAIMLGSAKVYPVDPVYGIFFVYVLYGVVAKSLWGERGSRSWKVFAVYLLFCLLALIRGGLAYGHSAVGESRAYLLPVLFYFIPLLATRSGDVLVPKARRVLWAIVVMVPLNIALFSLGLRGENLDSRFRYLHAVEALVVSFAVVALLVWNAVEVSGRSRVLRACLAVLLMAAILLSQVRSTWVALAVMLAMMCNFAATRRPVLEAAIGCAALAVVYAVAIHGDLQDKISEDFEKSGTFLRNWEEDDTASWRFAGWEQELEVFQGAPILGQGLGGYSMWFDGREWQKVAVHNGYIMALSKFGIVGVSIFLVGLAFWFREMWKVVRLTTVERWRAWLLVCQICVLGHLVYAFFYDLTPFFWLLLGVGEVLRRDILAEEEKPTEEISPEGGDVPADGGEQNAGTLGP